MPGTSTTVNTSEINSGIVTTTNGQVDTVTFDGETDEIEILAYDGTDWIWYTIDGSAPTVGGKTCYPLPPVAGAYTVHSPPSRVNAQIKLIAATASKYVVTRVNP